MEFEHSGIFLVELVTKNVVLGSLGTYVMHMRIKKVFLIFGLPDQGHNISHWTLPIKQSFYPLNSSYKVVILPIEPTHDKFARNGLPKYFDKFISYNKVLNCCFINGAAYNTCSYNKLCCVSVMATLLAYWGSCGNNLHSFRLGLSTSIFFDILSLLQLVFLMHLI